MGGKKGLVEPYVSKFEKFNSNTGWTAGSHGEMEALSHFSYDYTGGQCILCDLQGQDADSYYLLTDPVILSKNGEFGATDGGCSAMANFFAHHRCTKFCSSSWDRIRAAAPKMSARSA